ncbi:MAG: biotin--[acetyl-CoA-carboxylase] ligase [Bacteroidales bacterium]|nr:biotin--[acetyl-CoA-carboxylase] ligase [Bacteroidales bacterium]
MSEIYYIEEADSSNNIALLWIETKQLPEFSIVWVGNQTQGKGQGNRKWITNPNENITMSAIVYPVFLSFEWSFYLSKVSALATHELISSICQHVTIKWPNDIYVGRNKIAGILIENKLHSQGIKASIIGVGINVNQKQFSAEIPNPTSLSLETKKHYELINLIKQWQRLFQKYYQWLIQGKYNHIDMAYHKHLFLKDSEVKLRLKCKQTVSGVLKQVNKKGELEVSINNQINTFAIGDVELIL